jgi:hypothetical protein
MLNAATWGTSTNTTIIRELKQGSQALQQISNAFAFLGADVRICTIYETDRMDWLKDPVRPSSPIHEPKATLVDNST